MRGSLPAGMPSSTSCSVDVRQEGGDVVAQRVPQPVRQAALLAEAAGLAVAAARHARLLLDGLHDLGDRDVARRGRPSA